MTWDGTRDTTEKRFFVEIFCSLIDSYSRNLDKSVDINFDKLVSGRQISLICKVFKSSN